MTEIAITAEKFLPGVALVTMQLPDNYEMVFACPVAILNDDAKFKELLSEMFGGRRVVYYGE